MLSRPNPRHVVMFTETAEIAIQLLDPFLVCLDALSLQPFLELEIESVIFERKQPKKQGEEA